MHRRFITLAILVLCFSPLCFSAVDQQQFLQIAGLNDLMLSGNGLVMGASTNTVNGSAIQQAATANGRIVSLQVEDAALMQVIVGSGMDGAYGVNQSGLGTGLQTQTQDNNMMLGNQNQAAGVGFNTDTALAGGKVFLGTMQAFVGSQTQLIMTPYGMSLNLQPISVVEQGTVYRTQ